MASKQEAKLMLICTTEKEGRVKFTSPGLFADYSEIDVDSELVQLFDKNQETERMMSQTRWEKLPIKMRSQYNQWRSQKTQQPLKNYVKITVALILIHLHMLISQN